MTLTSLYGQKRGKAPVNVDSLNYAAVKKAEAKGNQKLTVWYLTMRGDTARLKGDLARAEEFYLQARSHTEEILGDLKGYRISIFNETVFDPYDRLGEIYLQANNLRKAEELYNESRQVRERHLPRKSLFRVPPYVGLGEVAMAKDDFTEAGRLFLMAEKQLYSATTSFYNFGPIEKSLVTRQFLIALNTGEYRKARKYMRKMSTGGFITSQSIIGAVQIPRVLELKARYYMHAGDFIKAEYYLNKALIFSETQSNTLSKIQILKTRALLHWTRDNIPQATESFDQLVEVYKEYISENFAGMSEYEREQFFMSLRDDFELYNSFVAQNLGQGDQSKFGSSVFNNQLFSKAMLLNEINKLKDQIIQSGDSDLNNLLRDWEAAKAELATLYFQPKGKTGLINQTESQINDLERELNRRSRFLRVFENEPRWEDVRSRLKENEAAVEIVRLRNYNLTGKEPYQFSDSIRYMIAVVSTETEFPELHILDNGNDLEGRYLSYYRNTLRNRQTDTLSYSHYWLPIREYVKDFRKVYLSLDGVYNLLNLNSLRNPNSGKYLVDEIDLAFVTNSKDLLRMDEKVVRNEASLYGRPTYRLDSAQVRIAGRNALRRERTLTDASFENFREQDFTDLPGTEDEVRAIAELLDSVKWTVNARYEEEANESDIKNDSNPYVLHIATHGFFLRQDNIDGINSMIRSGLILAGVNNKNLMTDDGILTAYEATNLVLDSTYLVVLSACETGLGEVRNGEGVYGLQRGFLVAGARFVLMSLWKVDDFATRTLMEEFYTRWLEGMEIHEALKTAQQKLRKDYPHPYYWGAFILLGS